MGSKNWKDKEVVGKKSIEFRAGIIPGNDEP